MVRQNLPDYLKTYYGAIDNIDIPKVEVLKVKNYVLFTLTLYRLPDMTELNDKNQPIYVYYLSTGKKRPTVNCTDILGGVMKWDEEKKKAHTNYPIAFVNSIIATVFKRWNTFIVCTDNRGMFNEGEIIEKFELSLKNVAYNNIEALKFIRTLETTDVDNIYSIGVSLGALTMAALYGLEDSYTKAVIILGGYSLSDIVIKSKEGIVRKFYDRMKLLYGDMTDDKIVAAMLYTDELFNYIPKHTTLQILSTQDTSVPDECQDKLRELIQPKEYFKIKYSKLFGKLEVFQDGHYQTLIYYPYLIYRSLKYLSQKEKNMTEENKSIEVNLVKEGVKPMNKVVEVLKKVLAAIVSTFVKVKTFVTKYFTPKQIIYAIIGIVLVVVVLGHVVREGSARRLVNHQITDLNKRITSIEGKVVIVEKKVAVIESKAGIKDKKEVKPKNKLFFGLF